MRCLSTLNDFESILDRNLKIRDRSTGLGEECIELDVWRTQAPSQKKRKRYYMYDDVIPTGLWDLGSVDARDKPCFEKLLGKISTMKELECQFDIDVHTTEAHAYLVDMHILDRVKFKKLKAIVHECRSFCKNIIVDFAHKVIRLECLRMTAPLLERRKRLRIRH